MVAEIIKGLTNFRLIEPDFDGMRVLEGYYRTGRYESALSEEDVNQIRKMASDFESDLEAVDFLSQKPQRSDTRSGSS